MPPLEKHYEISMKRTGNGYRELHEWIDSDPSHHDISGIHRHREFIENNFGQAAVEEYVQHIKDDLAAKFGSLGEDCDGKLQSILAYFGCAKNQ